WSSKVRLITAAWSTGKRFGKKSLNWSKSGKRTWRRLSTLMPTGSFPLFSNKPITCLRSRGGPRIYWRKSGVRLRACDQEVDPGSIGGNPGNCGRIENAFRHDPGLSAPGRNMGQWQGRAARVRSRTLQRVGSREKGD